MSIGMWALVALCCILLGLLLGVVLTARRIDRLNRTVMKSRRALEHALTARAQYAHDFASCGVLDLAGAILLVDAADACLRAGMQPIVDDGLDTIEQLPRTEHGVDRRELESNLSRTLRLTVDELEPEDIPQSARKMYDRLQRARLDMKMIRSFHNGHVAQVRQVRSSQLAVVFPAAGRAPYPVTVDLDDE